MFAHSLLFFVSYSEMIFIMFMYVIKARQCAYCLGMWGVYERIVFGGGGLAC